MHYSPADCDELRDRAAYVRDLERDALRDAEWAADFEGEDDDRPTRAEAMAEDAMGRWLRPPPDDDGPTPRPRLAPMPRGRAGPTT